MAGNYRAAEVVLKVIARRSKVLGFDKLDADGGATQQTIVIGGTTNQYLAGLRDVIAAEHG